MQTNLFVRALTLPKLSLNTLTEALAAAAMLLGAACGQQARGPRFQPPGAASAGFRSETEAQQSPFGGTPAVDIPPQAKAMGAFLQAEVATEEGDRTEALKALEEAVQVRPGQRHAARHAGHALRA